MAEDQTPLGGDEESTSTSIVLREEGESTATTLTRTAAGDVLTPITVTRRRKERHRSAPLIPEFRRWSATGLEVREAGKTNEIVISGTPIVYDTPYVVLDMFGEFEERMAPGVASAVLPVADVRFLYDHDGMVLARNRNDLGLPPTMVLRDTPTGLTFEARLDARMQTSNDLACAVERGDISQMSCGFIVADDEWNDAMDERTVKRFADLLDISAVKYPASPTTSLQIAQRMALAVPVESRARLRNVYLDLRAGRGLTPERVEAFRALLNADLDPGDDLQTPEGTGRLGRPDGNGPTWANDDDLGLPDGTPEDGTEGEGTTDGTGFANAQDGTGSRSQTSRATRIRVKRALRGL